MPVSLLVGLLRASRMLLSTKDAAAAVPPSAAVTRAAGWLLGALDTVWASAEALHKQMNVLFGQGVTRVSASASRRCVICVQESHACVRQRRP